MGSVRNLATALLCGTALTAVAVTGTRAASVNATWAGGSDNWNNGAQWTFSTPPVTATFPDNDANDTFNVFIDGGDPGGSTVNLNVTVTIDTLSVSGGDTLNFNNGQDMTVAAGSLINNGTINLNAIAAATDLTFTLGGSITGLGTISLSDSVSNRLLVGGGGTITHGAGHTIVGAGQLLVNTGGFDNAGTIRQQGSQVLTIDPAGSGFVNSGTLRAEGAGGITLGAAAYQNNTTIEAANGSAIRLNNGVTITGGNLATTGSGEIRSNAAGGGVTLDGVTVTAGSKLVQDNGTDFDIANGITNNGTWSLNGIAASTDIRFVGSQTIGGTGEMVLSDSISNRITAAGAGDVLTLGASQTIRGAGQLLLNAGGAVNNGTILQQGSQALTVDPGAAADAGGGANFINNGTFRAEGSGGIGLNTGIYQNNTTMEAANGSEIRLNVGATVIGGNFTTTGSGEIRSTALSGGVTLDGVTVTAGSKLVQDNGTDFDIRNGITNNGTWSLNGIAASTDVRFVGSQTIGGTGETVLSDSVSNRITAAGAGDVLTVGANQTIRGAGQFLLNAGGAVNQGTVVAEGTAAALVIDAGVPGFDNRGTLRAAGTAGIDLGVGGNGFVNSTGLVDVQAASRLDVIGGNYLQTGGQTTVNGLMTTTGTGTSIDLQGGTFGGTGTVDFGGSGAHALNNTGGTLAAGNSPGILTIQDGDYVQGAVAAFEFELFGAVAGIGHDLLSIINGDADLAGTLQVIADQTFAATLSVGDQFEVIRLLGGAFLGTNFLDQIFDSLTVNLTGLAFTQLFIGDSLWIEVTQADVDPPGGAVPAPATFLVLLGGLGGMIVLRRRRKSA